MGGGVAHPVIVAVERVQRSILVELALRDPGDTALAARTHKSVNFYVWDRPVGIGQGTPRRWLQVGFHAGFGGVFFYDDPRSATDQQSVTGEDWAWVALRSPPMDDPPIVYFDQDTHTQFPPRAVMPLEELRELVGQWVNCGARPTSVEWLTVNALRWTLASNGDLATAQQAV